tara:strand:- start:2585 stop:3409 length:825 start_codon:yes stop_codon:yes gene_type:complete
MNHQNDGPLGLWAEDLRVKAGGKQILKDVTFCLPRGGVVGLIGPNGAGKSTLLRATLNLITPQSGRVRIDGRDSASFPPKERARKIAYMAQGAPVHWPLTVGYLVALGRIPHLDPWRKLGAQDRAAIDRALRLTDTLHLKDRITTTLSGGERACAMLARAIVSDAPYLLVDEPVASLDPFHQLQVMTILKDLAREGHGVMIVLHDLTLAQRFCDHLILLHEGEVLAQGGPDTVLNDEYLARAFHIRAARWRENGDHFLVPRTGLAPYERETKNA